MSDITEIKDILRMEVGHTVSGVIAKIKKAQPIKPGYDNQMVNLTWYDKGLNKAFYIMAYISSAIPIDFTEHDGEIITLTGGQILIGDNPYKGTHINKITCTGVDVAFGLPGYNDSPKPAEASQPSNTATEAQASSKANLTDTTKSIIFQAMIKAVIGTCSPKEEWEGMIDHAKSLHDKKVREW